MNVEMMLKIRPSGLLPSGSWLEGLFCVWAIYALRLFKRKKAPPANYPKVEGQRGSEVVSFRPYFDSQKSVSISGAAAGARTGLSWSPTDK